MKLSNRELGIIGMIGAPFLFIEMHLGKINNVNNTSLGGVCDLVYMTGWICSLAGLKNLQATGSSKAGRIMLQIQFFCLAVACTWNIWVVIDPNNQSLLFRILDMFWPASNILLFITGIIIALNKTNKGFTRYAALIAGSWLPLVLIYFIVLRGRNEASFYVMGIYSTVAWFLMGMMIFRKGKQQTGLRGENAVAVPGF